MNTVCVCDEMCSCSHSLSRTLCLLVCLHDCLSGVSERETFVLTATFTRHYEERRASEKKRRKRTGETNGKNEAQETRHSPLSLLLCTGGNDWTQRIMEKQTNTLYTVHTLALCTCLRVLLSHSPLIVVQDVYLTFLLQKHTRKTERVISHQI